MAVYSMCLEEKNTKAVFQGLRHDEQTARVHDGHFEKKRAAHLSPERVLINHILHFTECLLWDTYKQYNIPYRVSYEQGYRSLRAKTTSAIAETGVPAWE